MFTKRPWLGRALTTALLVCGCNAESDDNADPSTPNPQDENNEALEEAMDDARRTYADIVLASYEDSLELAEVLRDATQAFVDDPSEANLETARDAWLDAREPYLQTEVYRFYEGPIDNEDDGPEGALNAWPLDENYIDYVEGMPEAGIVNDLDTAITKEQLLSLNEQGGDANIATGYHAIEFLLWGQDHADDGPGERPYTDYVSGEDATAENPERRAEYLMTVSDLLVEHLSGLVNAWSENTSDNYRDEFESIEPREATRRILTGMIMLSGFETGGERLQAALDTGEQEDEHSCFSDNTHRDMIQDIQGVLNVYHGRYVRLDDSTVNGTPMRAVVEELDSGLAEELDEALEQALSLANDLEPPFDREIARGNSEGRQRVQDLIDALRIVEGHLEEVFLDLDFSIPEP